jgi:N-acetylglutamate synthase-like GNAT family acetyltransferase
MGLRWLHETPPYWDADKARIVGEADPAVFGHALSGHALGDLLPNDWWRVEKDGRVVGYGWMDVNWGDAEILLAVAPEARKQGVGTFILDRLEDEARTRGLNYLHNVLRSTHPAHDEVDAWLRQRSFTTADDGRLHRAIVRRRSVAALRTVPATP